MSEFVTGLLWVWLCLSVTAVGVWCGVMAIAHLLGIPRRRRVKQ